MPSDRYPIPESAAERPLRETRQRFDGLQPIKSYSQESINWIAQQEPDVQAAFLSRSNPLGVSGVNVVGQSIRATHPIASATDLAPLICKARKRMKMSQQQFADACGVGRRFLSELENGKPSLEFDKVLKCALGAGIDLLAKPRLPL